MKEYTVQEVFEEKEGTKFKDTEGDIYIIKNRTVLKVYGDYEERELLLNKRWFETRFIKMQEAVSFMEALNSENKCRVESEIILKVYNKRKNGISDDEYEKEVLKDLLDGKYCYINTIIYALGGRMGCSDWKEFINNGKFYLEEE